MSLKQEPELGKNFWLAMVLSMIVLIGYPQLLKWTTPQKTAGTGLSADSEMAGPNRETVETPAAQGVSTRKDFLSAAQKPEYTEFESANYKIHFSTLGGTVVYLEQRAESKPGAPGMVFYSQPEKNAPVLPGIFGIRLAHDPVDLTATVFKVKTADAGRGYFEFEYEKPGEYRLTKTFQISAKTPTIQAGMALQNLSGNERHYPLEFIFGMNYDPHDKTGMPYYEALAAGEKIESAKAHAIEKKGFFVEKPLAWSGLMRKYYVMAVRPEWKIIGQETHATAERMLMQSTLRLDPLTLMPAEQVTRKFFVYAGPERYEALKKTGAGFEAMFSRGFFGIFKLWLLFTLKFIYRYIPNYGWCIILLTLLIKIIFAPITNISFASQRKMQVIQPKMKALQERYKGNAEKLHKETMALFKRNRVNPMAGCLPMLVQMPVLLAMYRVLPEAIELQGAPFIGWIHDLSQPDHFYMLPFTIPFLGWTAINILPFLMIASQYGFQKIMPQPATTSDQTAMFAFMPLFFGFICYNMPSGLVLYWFVQNVLSIVHHLLVSRAPVFLHHEDKE